MTSFTSLKLNQFTVKICQTDESAVYNSYYCNNCTFIIIIYRILNSFIVAIVSRHTIVCQSPRKPCGTQVGYLQELLTHHFQPLVSIKFTYCMLSIYMQHYIPNLKKISPVVLEICVSEN